MDFIRIFINYHYINHEIINKVTKGILLNFKKVEKYKEGTNVIPEEKIDLEVWSYKDNKLIFEKI